MGISSFIKNLRSKIGHDLLQLLGVSVVVLNDRGEVLLVKSVETGQWHPIGGMVEPGEEPADSAVREVLEETGVEIVPEKLVGVYDGPLVTYANHDRVHYVTLVFKCRAIGGVARVNDDENSEVRYFAIDSLPSMREDHARNVADALKNSGEAVFLRRSDLGG